MLSIEGGRRVREFGQSSTNQYGGQTLVQDAGEDSNSLGETFDLNAHQLILAEGIPSFRSIQWTVHIVMQQYLRNINRHLQSGIES